ncbi:hypothetical protein V1264_003007 [Littorina saxatilis]|uniref:Apple domain-containing protein n=1 Tax=Littorina saxatilis TaxID=31220 RepID=A0AAN9B3T9_9CAEN
MNDNKMRLTVNHILTTLTLLVSCDVCLSTSQQRSGLYALLTNDYIFDDAVVFTSSSVKSELHCVLACLEDCTCVSLTYNPNGGVCRGHSVNKAFARASISPGTRVIVLTPNIAGTWLEQSCTLTSDCPAAQSACVGGKCVPALGNYYSEGSNSCVDSCELCALQTEFVTYDRHAIWGNLAYEVTGTSRDGCLATCQNDTLCPAVTYDSHAMNCKVHHLTWKDVPASGLKTDLGGWFYFQKKCA